MTASQNPSPTTEVARAVNVAPAGPSRTELPASTDPRTWSVAQTALMEFAGLARNVQRDGATVVHVLDRGVAQAFLHVCQTTGLDPFAKQIYAMEVKGKLSIVVGVDGFRVIAQRSRGYRGQVGPQWTRDGREWVDAWLPELQGGNKGDKPAAARIGILRDGFADPLWQVVTWDEFGVEPRYERDNWGVRPAHMLGIRAETHGLRRAFPNDLSGLYTPEDFDDDVMVQAPAGESVERENIAAVAGFSDVAALRVFYDQKRDAGQLTDALHASVMGRAGVLQSATPANPAAPTTEPGQEPPSVPDAPEDAPEPDLTPQNGAERDPAEPSPDEYEAMGEGEGDR